MQSPLTPQRGRIESNPREYTHMGLRFCGELETMLADWHGPRVPAARAWKIGHSRYPTVRKSSLVHHSRISRLSFVSNMRDDRKMREKYER